MNVRAFSIFGCALFLFACAAPGSREVPRFGTFSIVAFDPETGDLGVAVQSKVLAVGAVVPYAKAGVGAIATQAWANPTYGPDGLEALGEGKSARETVEFLTGGDRERARRQIGVVDAKGNAASFTGKSCTEWAGHIEGNTFCVQGNILASEEVVKGMAKAFEETKGLLPDRLLAALEAGQKAGGDKRGKQSAAILVVREKGGYGGGNDRWVDLRVDDHVEPIPELKRLYELHKKLFGAPAPAKKSE